MDQSPPTKKPDGDGLLNGLPRPASIDKSTSTSTPTENSDGGRLQMSKQPSDQGDHFQQRARFAHDIARRLADGANLDSLAHQTNMTVDQVVRMVAMFAVQASDVGKVCLGTEEMYAMFAKNEEGKGVTAVDGVGESMGRSCLSDQPKSE
ncbi:hypothetical protein LTR46_000716 [Exophiala xenobiotica]|nr:hypothetical protein LTR46_000716 [Exophiala xenobiotica]